MPNIKSAKKRLRQSQVRRDRNRAVRSELRTRTKALLATEDAAVASHLERVLPRRQRSTLVDRHRGGRAHDDDAELARWQRGCNEHQVVRAVDQVAAAGP